MPDAPADALPADIEDKLARCQAIVDADALRIDETLESLDEDAQAAFLEDDPSIVHRIEEVRRAARRSTRKAALSRPPATQPAKTR